MTACQVNSRALSACWAGGGQREGPAVAPSGRRAPRPRPGGAEFAGAGKPADQPGVGRLVSRAGASVTTTAPEPVPGEVATEKLSADGIDFGAEPAFRAQYSSTVS